MSLLYEYDAVYYAGKHFVGGADESGRGSLFGPVACAVWVPDYTCCISGINDSKLLTAVQRENLIPQIISNSVSYAVEFVTAEEIDNINILNATKEGIFRAFQKLKVKPQFFLVDALFIEKIPKSVQQISLIKGDRISYAIAGASILAKFFRDSYMKNISKEYPKYQLDIHKGYPTRMHREALTLHGVSPLHRKSFRTVQKILEEKLSITKS